MSPLPFDQVPEHNRVSDLLGDLMPGMNNGNGNGHSVARPSPPSSAADQVTSWTVQQFLASVNWHNAPPPPASFSESDGATVPVSSLTLTAFLGLVNWRNAVNAPGLPTLGQSGPIAVPPTIHDVLSEFVWE
jgi:hypothetical protein